MGTLIANWKWILAIVTLFVFVATQHALYISLVKACREFKDALKADAAAPERRAGGFEWLHDVHAMFAQGSGTWNDNAPLPREAVIDSLDNELWRSSRYSALQRWGLAAPLIGVILSALGFMVSPPELTGAVQDIMTKLGPLFVGVFAGALMALVNQIYLHYAAMELGSVRAAAVRWFDDVIWKSIRQNAHNVLGQAAAETQSAAKSLVTSSQQLADCNLSYRDTLLDLGRQMADVRIAAQSTYKSFDSFSVMIADMTDRLGVSINNLSALNNTAAAVENAGVVWNVAAAKVLGATAAIEESSVNFKATCGNFSTNFDDVRQSMKAGIAESTGGLVSAVNGLTQPLQELQGSIQLMKANTDKHTELSTALTAAVQQSDRFLVERMALNLDEAEMQREMATRTRTAIDSLTKLTETANHVGNTSTSLNAAATGLKEASATISTALKTMFETCNGFSNRFAEMQGALNTEVSGATVGLQSAARELAKPVQMLNTSLTRVSSGAENHAELSERLENVAKQAELSLKERARGNADEASRLERMEKIESRLGQTAQLLTESAANMQNIQKGLDALVGELRLAREVKGPGRRRWLPWLSSPEENSRS